MYPGERFNASAHIGGLALFAGFAAHALAAAAGRPDRLSTFGVYVFLASAVLLYATSVAAHSTRGEAQRRWERLDRGTIFLLIAGSLTPFALCAPRESASLLALGAVWLLAAAACWRQLRPQGGTSGLADYLVLGWGAVLAAAPIAARVSGASLAWLLAGAVLYSAGTLFYRHPGSSRHAHGIWHVFVVAGSGSHYVAISHLA